MKTKWHKKPYNNIHKKSLRYKGHLWPGGYGSGLVIGRLHMILRVIAS